MCLLYIQGRTALGAGELSWRAIELGLQLKTKYLRTSLFQNDDVFCNPGPGKPLCPYAMIKSKINLVSSGESPKGIPTGYPSHQILQQKKN